MVELGILTSKSQRGVVELGILTSRSQRGVVELGILTSRSQRGVFKLCVLNHRSIGYIQVRKFTERFSLGFFSTTKPCRHELAEK